MKRLLTIGLIGLSFACANKPNSSQIAVADFGTVAQVGGQTYFANFCSDAKMAADKAVNNSCIDKATDAKKAEDALNKFVEAYKANPTSANKTLVQGAVCAYSALFPAGTINPALIAQANCAK